MNNFEEEAAKEVLSLVQDQISSLFIRKRQREDAAQELEIEQLKEARKQLQEENMQLRRENNLVKGDNRLLKDEDRHLKQRLTPSIQRCYQANQILEKVKQSNEELGTDNQRLKEEQEHQHQAWLILVRNENMLAEEVKNQTQSIKTFGEQVYKLGGENQSLKSRLERLEQHEVASKNTVSRLKLKLSLALEALSEIDSNLGDNALLVSCLIESITGYVKEEPVFI
jgi:chromosome segregation ATPase